MKRLFYLIESLWDRISQSDWYSGEYVSSDTPIIIGGCARSGTTLIRVMLDTHPKIYCGPESNLFLPIRIKTRRRLKELSWKFDIPLKEVDILLTNSSCLSEFIEKFFNKMINVHGKRRWAEKSPRNVLRLDYIFKHFPMAKFIHMIRDGRDVACSLRTFPKRKIVDGSIVPVNTNRPLDECVRRWVHDVKIGRKYENDPRYIEVKYEDLILNTRESLKKLFKILHESFDEKILKYHEVKSNTRDIMKFPQNIEATRPLNSGSIGRWKNELNKKELKLFKKLGGDLLIKTGYEKDKNW